MRALGDVTLKDEGRRLNAKSSSFAVRALAWQASFGDRAPDQDCWAQNKSTKQRHPGTRLHSNKLISLVYSDDGDLFFPFSFGLLTVSRAAASPLTLQHSTAPQAPPVLLRIEASTVSPGNLV